MRVSVDLGDRSYDVVLEEGARHRLAGLIAERAPSARVAVIVTSPSIAALSWFNFASGIDQHVLVVPDGEAAKSLDVQMCIRDSDIAELLARCELATSHGEARRFVEQGGVYVNNVRVEVGAKVDASQLLHGRYVILRRGRRQMHLVVAA